MNRGAAAAAGGALAAACVVALAAAQAVDVERARTLVVGIPPGLSRTDRVDPARTGRTRDALPSSALRTEWRTPLGVLLERAPVVDARAITYVVGTRGEVIAAARDGTERWRASTGATQPGPLALLSDDTLVFVDATGEATAVRDGLVRWRVRFGTSDSERPAPLPLDDGGVVVASTHDLAALDAGGRERARTTLAEAIAGPLLAALGKVVFVGSSGTVWSWTPGAPEPTRIAGFGASISDGAALAGDRTLVAISAGQTRLLAVDLVRGTVATRAGTPPAPAALWLGPPATRGSVSYLLVTTLASELFIAVDAHGSEIARTMLASHPVVPAPDGGPAGLAALPHSPLLVDSAGTVAFATSGGAVGVASGAGAELLPDACPSSLGSAGRTPLVAGLAPLRVTQAS